MKTFQTPKVVELGMLQQIVLGSPQVNNLQEPDTGSHGSNGTNGS